MPYEPDNEFPDHEELPLDAGDAEGGWPVGAFGDVEDRPIGVWGSVDANDARWIHGDLLRYSDTPFGGEIIKPEVIEKSIYGYKKLTLVKPSDVYFFSALFFLFGVIAGLFLAAYLDSRLPK